MSKPLFRIEELIEALLKGSPDDPVYLRVGSSTYGIQAIDNGSIRVKSDKNTQDATQVVKTLRQYASGTPKGEDTGIAWRIVGVGGGTAIRSVSYDNGKIVVKTLANEGKKMDAESSPDYDASTYDPLSESATPSGYDPVTFGAQHSILNYVDDEDGQMIITIQMTDDEATIANAKEIIDTLVDKSWVNWEEHTEVGKGDKEITIYFEDMGGNTLRTFSYDVKGNEANDAIVDWFSDYDYPVGGYTADAETFEAPKAKAKKPKKEKTYRQTHDATVSTKIRSLMHEFDRTGMVGRSKPANRKAALNQAVAVAYSMTASTYKKSGKRLPKGVKRAEGEQSHPFDAPMGYNPEGSRPFYGNPRRLARDRWGNLRFIRRRKDGTYMDNVDFGRSIKTDRRMKAKTWAPSGFRDQGDGSLGLLTSLMGAEGTDWNLEFGEDYDVSIPANPTENQEELLDVFSSYQYYDSEYHDKILNRGLEIADETDFRKLLGVCQQHDGIIDSSHPAEAYIIAISCYDALRSDAMDAETSPDYNASAYDPLSESATPSGYDPVTFEASRRSGSDAGQGTCGGCGEHSEHRMNFGRRKMCYDCAVERYPSKAAESGDSVWLVNSALDGNWEEALLFRDKSDARASFEEYIDQLGGKVADASYGDWSGDDGFRRVVMYQVTIQ